MIFREIETERLLLKNISSDDREFIFSQFSDSEVNKFLFDAEPLVDIHGADEIIDFYVRPEPKWQHRWILVKKDDAEKIGTCGFHCWDINSETSDGMTDRSDDVCRRKAICIHFRSLHT